jgi:hypothetical protein
MITGLAGSIVVMSCLGCAPPDDTTVRVAEPQPSLEVGVGPVLGNTAFDLSLSERTVRNFPTFDENAFEAPKLVGNTFHVTRMANPADAGRFRAMDLETPLPLRMMEGDTWGGEVSFGASKERTGLGFDVQVAPRAQIQRGRSGNNIARTGGEIRLGPSLIDRDQRGKQTKAPSWYFFVGEDNEALVWNFADQNAMVGAALRDQVTVGDLHAGVAWTTGRGSQVSFGMIEREMSYSDAAGNNASRRDQFAAFSWTLKK